MSRPAEAYEAIVARALRLSPDDRVYIETLAESWRPEIADLLETPQSLRLERMAASNPDTHVDNIVEWVDAYPSGLVSR